MLCCLSGYVLTRPRYVTDGQAIGQAERRPGGLSLRPPLSLKAQQFI